MKKNVKKIARILTLTDAGKVKFLLLLILAIISSLLNILPISFLGKISDILSSQMKLKFSNSGYVLKYLLIYLIIVIASTLVRNIFCYYSSKYSNRIIYSIRNMSYEKLLNINDSYISNSDKGTVINTIYNNTARLEVIFSTALFTLISDCFDLFWIMFFISSISFTITGILFMGIPILIYIGYRSGIYQKELAENKIKEEKSMINYLTQTFINIDVIRTFLGEKREVDQFDKYNKDYYKISNTSDKSLSSFYIFEKLIRTAFICISLVYLSIGILKNSYSIGSFLVIAMYADKFYSPITNIIRYYQMIQKGLASIDDIDNFLNESNRVKYNNLDWSQNSGFILVDKVALKVGEKLLIENFSCEIKDKSINVISGQSGTGKTSLIKCLLGINTQLNGQIVVNKKLKNIDKLFAYASQDINLFNGSILENALYPEDIKYISEEKLQRTRQLLYEVGLSENMLLQQVGVEGNSISGGEKKRVAFVRAICSDSPVIILDEITANLDKENKEKIEQLIINESKYKCIILITHEDKKKFSLNYNYNLIEM